MSSMTNGFTGESCVQAIRSSMHLGECLTFAELYRRAKSRGTWTDATIRRQVMQLIVNLPPARLEWPSTQPFLLLNLDDTFELYDPKHHPKPIAG